MPLHADALPSFPWDSLTPYAERAAAYPGGPIDLSVGTPVDPTPEVATRALADAAQAPGYPQTIGTPALRAAMVAWWRRRRGAHGLTEAHVLPTIGSKEAVALVPAMLGLGAHDAVLHPRAAYPTYDVGARLTGALPVPVDVADPGTWDDAVEAAARAAGRAETPRIALVWVNSPGNPDGTVLDVAALAGIVRAARARGALVASDECYAELGWDGPWASEAIPSLLDPRVLGAEGAQAPDDPFAGVLALYSLSKQSNMAGYRAAMLAGDANLVARLRELRKHAGFMLSAPVQAAMAAALADDEHVAAQRARYGRRRAALVEALADAELVREAGSVAGLYLWLTPTPERVRALSEAGRDWDCWDLVGALAERGILVAPGAFYGDREHVRLGLTGTDAEIAEACRRLREGPLL